MSDITLSSVDHGAPFNWGRTSGDYAKYRDIYPARFYDKLRELGIGLPGQRVLDLGTGTGVLPRAMQRSGARFTGADISPEQIAMARALSQGMEIDYIVSSAEDIDFPPHSFDVVTACQCFWYFDRAVVLPKLHRALKPGGRLAVLSMIWMPGRSKILRGSKRLVLKYNPKWSGGNHWREKYIAPGRNWANPLFKMNTCVFFREDISFTRGAWHGRMMACRGIGASSLPGEKITAFAAEHRTYLDTLPKRFTIPHQITMLILKKI